jgi:hypothetical protein
MCIVALLNLHHTIFGNLFCILLFLLVYVAFFWFLCYHEAMPYREHPHFADNPALSAAGNTHLLHNHEGPCESKYQLSKEPSHTPVQSLWKRFRGKCKLAFTSQIIIACFWPTQERDVFIYHKKQSKTRLRN